MKHCFRPMLALIFFVAAHLSMKEPFTGYWSYWICCALLLAVYSSVAVVVSLTLGGSPDQHCIYQADFQKKHKLYCDVLRGWNSAMFTILAFLAAILLGFILFVKIRASKSSDAKARI